MNRTETNEREKMEEWAERYSALTNGSNLLISSAALWNDWSYEIVYAKTETMTMLNSQKLASRKNRAYRLLARSPHDYIAPC